MPIEALTCPKCGAPLQPRAAACPYCRVALVNIPDGPTVEANQADSPASPVEIPELPKGWTLHTDPWEGFSIALPPGWMPASAQGQITVAYDPIGITSATVRPYRTPMPQSARQVAEQYVALGRMMIPSFQAWQQGNAAPDSNRLTLRVRANRFGHNVEGVFNVLVDGPNVIVSGYQDLVEAVAARAPILSRILASYRPAERMPRQVFREPTENAYGIQVPQGWQCQLGLSRANIGGSASINFRVFRDPQGLVSAANPGMVWNFMDPGMNLFGMMTGFAGFGGPPSLSYMPAAQFASQMVVPWMGQTTRGIQIINIIDRPDLNELSQIDLARSGYAPGSFETSVAMLETAYLEGGTPIRQKSRVSVMRMPGAAMWNALLDATYRAPQAEFSTLEPVLTGILFSLQYNPAWQAGERQLANNYIQAGQRDIANRQRQISQTLSETSDIVAGSYWDRQASYDRISEARSDAMLGYQNVADTYSGDQFKVPSGYDRYWQDGLGNIVGGSWMTQPEVGWTPLEPTGI